MLRCQVGTGLGRVHQGSVLAVTLYWLLGLVLLSTLAHVIHAELRARDEARHVSGSRRGSRRGRGSGAGGGALSS